MRAVEQKNVPVSGEKVGAVQGCDVAIPPRPVPARYAELVAMRESTGMTKKECAILAGYSPNSPTSAIERSKQVKQAIESVEEQRLELMAEKGYRYRDIARRARNRATDKTNTANEQLANDKFLASLLYDKDDTGAPEGGTVKKVVNIIQKITFTQNNNVPRFTPT
jgi:hypothetical protein